ncbi:MAG TPA: DUF1501 domain-containing protein [Ilumatobacter sp.]|nr:DUF1501 domain-containing protein [Ilumatobacter sp.]
MTLEHDISTGDALRHLTAHPDRDLHALDRRRFLQLVGMGAGAGLVAAGPGSTLLDVLMGHDPSAWAAGPIGANDGVLVVIGMYGGNDGLNTVVPVDDPAYYDQHGNLAIAEGDTLSLDAGNGLHPELTALKAFWDRGQLAVVHGVGYPNDDQSHFNSMAYWMAGQPHGVPSTGWLGRWLDGYLNGSSDLFAAAEIGSGVPLHLIGTAARGTGVPDRLPGWGRETSPRDVRAYDTLRAMRNGSQGPWFGAVGQAVVDTIDVNARLAPFYPATQNELPDSEMERKLQIAARLVNANLGLRVLTVGWGDFDSHAGQPEMHTARMRELNAGISQFFATLDPKWATRVTLMTFSEFGRTTWANDGQGTDHGSAAPQFVFGANVKGGMYGTRPAFARLQRWERMAYSVDLRSYYASVLDGWLGGGSSQVLGGTWENLRLFAAGPGAGGSTLPTTPRPPYAGSAPGEFVPLTPARLVDTRTTGAPLGPGGVLRVPVAGQHDVPATGVTAVVANVTAVDAQQAHYFTVYPGGTARPGTSNINGGPGRAVPNLVVIGVGGDGSIEVFNSHGSTHCLVDVFGYFSSDAGAGTDRFVALAPQRLFDTRSGQGVRAGTVGHLAPVEIDVAGHAGVPSDATAVVLNLTVTEPDAPGYLRLTPAGQATAPTSNVNFGPGDTVPNLAVVRLGRDGRVALDGAGHAKHAVGDVFGYFGGAAADADGGLLRAVAPRRLLDTRDGTGAPAARVGPANSITVPVAGQAGVPDDAVAVVLNVAATNVAAPSFVTVWPAGEGMPGTSNLNLLPGQTLANLVICRLGTGGAVTFGNKRAECDVLADVLAYFRSG